MRRVLEAMKLKLAAGEQVIVRTRSHHRILIPALVNFLVTLAVMSFLLGYISRGSQPEWVHHYSYIGVFLVWAGGLLSLAFGSLRPLLAWANRITYLTNLRVVQKNFIGAPQPLVIPLGLVTEVQMRQSKVQGMAGAGDLLVSHGAYGQQQRTRLKDMPDAEHLHTLLTEELGKYRRSAAAQHAAQQGQGARPYEYDHGAHYA